MQNQLDAALADAESASPIASTPDLSATVLVRRGQISELKGQLFEAFTYFTNSAGLDPGGDGGRALARLADDIGLLEVQGKDPGLDLFAGIRPIAADPTAVLRQLTAIEEFLIGTPDAVAKVNARGGCRVVYAVIQLYLSAERKDIVIRALGVLRLLAQRGATDVWMGFRLLQSMAEQFADDFEVFVELLRLLQFVPPVIVELLNAVDFLTPLTHSLRYEYTPEDLKIVLCLLSWLTVSPQAIDLLIENSVIELCMEKRTIEAFMLLSRLCLSPEGTRRINHLGGLQWAFDILAAEGSPQRMLNAAMVIASQILLLTTDDNIARSERAVELAMAVALANAKSADVVGLAFGLLSTAVEFAPRTVIEKRAVQAASVILSVHSKDETAALRLITFLLSCAQAGLVEHVNQIRPAVPTAVKTMRDHSDSRVITERTVALAVLCGYPENETLLREATAKFPNSELLQKFVKSK
jgi:hypothetical protein